MVEGFKECKFTVIPREENYEADTLAVLASMLQVPENPKEKYQIEVRHRPLVPNNVDHSQVFEDDEQINRFFQMSCEFENLKIDQENMYNKGESADPEPRKNTSS